METYESEGVLHLGPDVGAFMTPEDELDVLELGERAADKLWSHELISPAWERSLEDKVFSFIMQMVGNIAERTSWRGMPYPPEWCPEGVEL